MRLIHIKHQWVLEKFGKLGTIACLELVQILGVAGIVILRFQKYQHHETRFRDCFPSTEVDDKIGRRNILLVVASVFLLILLELISYISMFNFLYKHNLSMRLVMSEKSVRERVRKNALDLFSHFLHFVAEILQVIFSIVANATFNSRFNVYALISFVFQSGVLYLLMMATSRVLRNEFVKIFIRNRTHLYVSSSSFFVIFILLLFYALCGHQCIAWRRYCSQYCELWQFYWKYILKRSIPIPNV